MWKCTGSMKSYSSYIVPFEKQSQTKQKFPEDLAEEINLENSQNLEKEKLLFKIGYTLLCVCVHCEDQLYVFFPHSTVYGSQSTL